MTVVFEGSKNEFVDIRELSHTFSKDRHGLSYVHLLFQ